MDDPRLVGSRLVWGNVAKGNPLCFLALSQESCDTLRRVSLVWPRGGTTYLAQRDPCLPSSWGS